MSSARATDSETTSTLAGASTTVPAAYLDASAVVKLLRAELESAALAEFLREWPIRVSSELLRIELFCFCRRQELPVREADRLLDTLELLPINPAVLAGACVEFSPPQRALDALHLATAQLARQQLGCLVSYDTDQLAAAAVLGWRTETPT